MWSITTGSLSTRGFHEGGRKLLSDEAIHRLLKPPADIGKLELPSHPTNDTRTPESSYTKHATVGMKMTTLGRMMEEKGVNHVLVSLGERHR